MSKSIVLIGPAYPFRGGMSTFNESLAKQFSVENHAIEIYTFTLQYPSFLFPGTSQYSHEKPPQGITIWQKINSINPFNWVKIGFELKRKKPAIIVVRFWLPFMGPCFGTILRIVKQNKFTKIICIADNMIPHEKRMGDAQFTRYFIKPIDAFITMSEKVMSDLKTLCTTQAIQVEHPLYTNFGEKIKCEDAKKYLGIDADTQVVLFFGFIRKYKGLDILLEAIHLLKTALFFEKQSVKFLIAGEFYENPQPYLDMISSLKIEEHLILKNQFITDSEVKYYLSSASCVVQPYKSATQSGVTPLAYHFEKPMIVSNVGGLPHLVPPSIGLVAEPNATSFAATIAQFFERDATYFEQNIKEEKQKYSWNKLTKAILDLAQSIKNK